MGAAALRPAFIAFLAYTYRLVLSRDKLSHRGPGYVRDIRVTWLGFSPAAFGALNPTAPIRLFPFDSFS